MALSSRFTPPTPYMRLPCRPVHGIAAMANAVAPTQGPVCRLERGSACKANALPSLDECMCKKGTGSAFCSAMPTGPKAKPAPRPGALPDQAPAANGFAAAAVGNGHSAGGLTLHGCLRRYVRSEQLAKWLCERWVPAPPRASIRPAIVLGTPGLNLTLLALGCCYRKQCSQRVHSLAGQLERGDWRGATECQPSSETLVLLSMMRSD